MNFNFGPPLFSSLQRPPLSTMVTPGSAIMIPPRHLNLIAGGGLTGLSTPANDDVGRAIQENMIRNQLNASSLLSPLLVRPPLIHPPAVSMGRIRQAHTMNPSAAIEIPKSTFHNRPIVPTAFDVPPPSFMLPNEFAMQQQPKPQHQQVLPLPQSSLLQQSSLNKQQNQTLQQPSTLNLDQQLKMNSTSKNVNSIQSLYPHINSNVPAHFHQISDGSDSIKPLVEMESPFQLDSFISDLHLEIYRNGSEAKNLTAPSGFCFCWGGVKANCGVTRGKVMYEVRILEHLAADFGENHIETSPHLLRIGWSMVHASLQLGEEQDSWGYGGTGKFSTNNKFSDYGEAYTIGDVITAFLDLDSKPASISFAKNGLWLGVASPLHGFKVDQKSHAMFPHILSKNCRFEVNFGQQSSWCPVQYVNHDHVFINNISPMYMVPGPKPPQSKSDCEVIMVVGLPGSGKTTWARKMFRDHPEKMYNIIGTDDLIDKMKVMGLPRKNNYSGRWEVLIQQATSCLNKIFFIASRKLRHYIIDQTNVYATARKRKMKNFVGFKRICAVLQPEDDELKRREWKRTFEEGKVVPEEAVMEMKMNYSLPDAEVDEHIDEVIWIELEKDASCQLVNQYNEEGSLKLPSRKRLSSTSLPNNSNNSSNNNSSSNNNMNVGFGQIENKKVLKSNDDLLSPLKQPREQQPYVQERLEHQQHDNFSQKPYGMLQQHLQQHSQERHSQQQGGQQQSGPQQNESLPMQYPSQSISKPLQQQQHYKQEDGQNDELNYKTSTPYQINKYEPFTTNSITTRSFDMPDLSIPPPFSSTFHSITTTADYLSQNQPSVLKQEPPQQQQLMYQEQLQHQTDQRQYPQNLFQQASDYRQTDTDVRYSQNSEQHQQTSSDHEMQSGRWPMNNEERQGSGIKPLMDFMPYNLNRFRQQDTDEIWKPKVDNYGECGSDFYRNDRNEYDDNVEYRDRSRYAADERVNDRWSSRRSREQSPIPSYKRRNYGNQMDDDADWNRGRTRSRSRDDRRRNYNGGSREERRSARSRSREDKRPTRSGSREDRRAANMRGYDSRDRRGGDRRPIREPYNNSRNANDRHFDAYNRDRDERYQRNNRDRNHPNNTNNINERKADDERSYNDGRNKLESNMTEMKSSDENRRNRVTKSRWEPVNKNTENTGNVADKLSQHEQHQQMQPLSSQQPPPVQQKREPLIHQTPSLLPLPEQQQTQSSNSFQLQPQQKTKLSQESEEQKPQQSSLRNSLPMNTSKPLLSLPTSSSITTPSTFIRPPGNTQVTPRAPPLRGPRPMPPRIPPQQLSRLRF